jgi:CRISPR-associated protein Cst1
VGLCRVLEFAKTNINPAITLNYYYDYIEFDERYLDDIPHAYFEYFYTEFKKFNNSSSETEFLKWFKNDLGQNFIGQASFNNTSAKADSISKCEDYFEKDFIKPLKNFLVKIKNSNQNLSTEESVKKKRKATKNFLASTPCVFCGEISSGDTFDEKRFVPLAVSSDGAKNFFWNGHNNLPICKKCVFLFMFAPAGVSEITYVRYKREDKDKFKREEEKYKVFVNLDASVEELLKINNALKDRVEEALSATDRFEDSIFRLFAIDLIKYLKTKALWSFENILVVEFNALYSERATKGVKKSKISYLSFPKHVAKFLISREGKSITKIQNTEFRNKLVNTILKNEDFERLIFSETYRMLYTSFYKEAYSIYLSVRIKCLLKYYKELITGNQMLKGDEKMVTDRLGVLFKSGRKIAEYYIEKEQENKLPALVYRLLNAAKVGDFHTVFDAIIRVYMNTEIQIPHEFIGLVQSQGASDFKDVIDPLSIAQAFVAGILYEMNKEKGSSTKQDKNENIEEEVENG